MDKPVLAIYGSGGLGREIYDIAQRRNNISNLWKSIIFINDFIEEGTVQGVPVIHFETLLKYKENYEVIIAIGEPSSREKLYNKLKDNGISLTTLIDPTALISPSAEIAEGTIVCEFSSVHCCVTIGKNCLIQPYSDIGHDIKIGNHSVFSPHFAPGGESVFGDRVYVGMHAALKEKLKIGNDVIVAMGSVVFRDIPDETVVIGNPARVTKGNDEGKVFK